jgi:hypothetical protein
MDEQLWIFRDRARFVEAEMVPNDEQIMKELISRAL